MIRESSGHFNTPSLVFDVKDGLLGMMASKLSLDLRNMWKSIDERRVHSAGQ